MRTTLSREKKMELAYASLTHRFIGEKGKGTTILAFRPENKLGLEGFYAKPYFTEAVDYKSAQTNLENAEKLERNLVSTASINALTSTENGRNFADDYYKTVEENQYKTGSVFESRFNAFKDELFILFTLKAQNNLYEAFTENLTTLQKASILDKAFVTEVVKDLFPDRSFSMETEKETVVENMGDVTFVEDVTLEESR